MKIIQLLCRLKQQDILTKSLTLVKKKITTVIPQHLLIFATITTFTLTIFLGTQLLLLLGGWFLLIFLTLFIINKYILTFNRQAIDIQNSIHKTEGKQKADNKRTTIQIVKEHIVILAYIYPIQEFIIKIFLFRNLIPFSYWWLNRIEHALFSGAITFLIFIISDTLVSNRPTQLLNHHVDCSVKARTLIDFFVTSTITISLVNLLGILNEILEYIIRCYTQPTLNIDYTDTMNDIVTNLIASIIAIIITKIYLSRYNKDYITHKLETSL